MIDPVALTQSLIRCPSVTPKEAGALDVLEAALTPMGFQCRRLAFEGDGGERTENLFARLGTGAPHFCFAGHVDVVPVGDAAAWTHDPFAAWIEGGYLYGRGAEDMKAAIACFVAAVSRVADRGSRMGSISLLITCDEEGAAINGTKKVLPWMKAHGHVPNVCLVGEPTNPTFIGEMVKIGRRGSFNAVLTVAGKQGHVAYPQLADNPVTTLVNILHALKTDVLDTGTEYFPPSNLEVVSVDVGNPSTNVIPASASARFNIRFNNLHTADGLKGWIVEHIERHTRQYDLTVRCNGEAFVFEPGALSQLVADSVEAVTGKKPVLSTTGGVSDALYIKDYCPVIEFGATGLTPHMVNERIRLDDIDLLARCYEEMLTRYFR